MDVLRLATVLQDIGNQKCLVKAQELNLARSSSAIFHFRDLDLNATNLKAIVNCLNVETKFPINSISFSYNPKIGDDSAIELMKNLPISISEVGLVKCGITDIGGIEILNWMRRATNLQMICMEHNDFSEKLKPEFESFKKSNPNVMVVY